MVEFNRINVARIAAICWSVWVASTWSSGAAKVTSTSWKDSLFPLHPIFFSLWFVFLFHSITFAMEARSHVGIKRTKLLYRHKNCMITSTFCCWSGLFFIMFNKVLNKDAGLLFFSFRGKLPRSPSTHAVYGLLWTTVSIIVMVFGMLCLLPEKDLPNIFQKRISPKIKILLKPAHRFFGALTCIAGIVAAYLGLQKTGDTGIKQGIILACLWLILYIPQIIHVMNDLSKIVTLSRLFLKQEKQKSNE